MALIDQVKDICTRLAPGGWHNLLLHHGLNILAPSLQDELRNILKVDRTLAGFEDFALSGVRGIEPGNPALSLLFHALANANVTVDAKGNPLQIYPTAAELETVMNYVYGSQPPSLQQLKERANGAPMAVVVFANEYRPAPDTVHKEQADMCFSRTGISRVGTAEPLYDAQSRGFLPFVADDNHAIRVLPARYAAYIAIQRKGNATTFGPMRVREEDETLDFWVPLHKLFNGTECIAGLSLDVQLTAMHKNEKIRRLHLMLGAGSGWEEPDISQPPFVITEGLGNWLCEQEFGAGLMAASPRRFLVEAAQYKGKPLTFNVPKSPRLLASTLIGPENAPEYVHIRHKVDDAGNLVNFNQQPGVLSELEKGDFRALHYLDFTADGWIQAQCPALDTAFPTRIPAYSLLCAPDFYPLCNQRHLSEWLETLSPDIQKAVFQTPPECLSDSRYAANIQSFPTLFSSTDVSVTAIVGHHGSTVGQSTAAKPDTASAKRASCLPDAAAGVFAPGWDVGAVEYESSSGAVPHLAAYRLGSPFPEDAKLCAALSSFWPAVAPDAAQSFEPDAGAGPTIKPMLDQEIGITSGFSWDGIPAPHSIITNNVTQIAYHSYHYGDYTESALEGKFSLALTGKIDTLEYQRRIDAFRRVKLALGSLHEKWFIRSFKTITSDDLRELDSPLNSNVTLDTTAYRFELYRYEPSASPHFNKTLIKVIETSNYLVWPHVIFHQSGARPWQPV